MLILRRHSLWTAPNTNRAAKPAAEAAQLVQMAKFSQKLDSKIREIDRLYLCLQQFDKFCHSITESGNDNPKS